MSSVVVERRGLDVAASYCCCYRNSLDNPNNICTIKAITERKARETETKTRKKMR
jgi:hypothetical protein